MTTAAGGAHEKRLFDRMALWCHHYDGWLWTAYVWLGVAVALAIPPSNDTWAGWWIKQIPLAFLVALVVSFYGKKQHMLVFWDCEHCASLQPLNAPEQAERYRRTLIAAHNKWQGIALFGIAVAMQLGVGYFLVRLLGSGFGAFALVPMWVFVLWMGFMSRKHGQLQPWCPICRRRDEDDDPIDVPAPTPPGARVEA